MGRGIVQVKVMVVVETATVIVKVFEIKTLIPVWPRINLVLSRDSSRTTKTCRFDTNYRLLATLARSESFTLQYDAN